MLGVAGRASVLWSVARDPALRRVEVTFAGFSFGEHAVWLAVLVYAFDRGGVREAGLLATVMLVAAVIAAPFAAYAGDRFRPGRALSAGYSIQALSMAATAVAMWFDGPTVAYVGAVVLTASVTFTRPVVSALLPTVAKRPGDLVAANVVLSAIGNLGMFVGPLIAAFVLTVADPATVFAAFAVVLALCAVLVTGVGRDEPAFHDPDLDAGALWTRILGGLVTLRRETSVASLVGMLAVGGLAAGALDVTVVSFADLRLDGGGGQAGILAAGVGLGAVLGSVAASGLMGGARLAPFLVAATIGVAVPLLALGGVGHLSTAFVLFASIGTGLSLLSVSATVAIQRRAPSRVLARIFGVVESLEMLAMAVGAAAIAVLTDRFGLAAALASLAVVVAVGILAATAWFRLTGGDVGPPPGEIVDRLLADPVFVHLDVPALERLAHAVTPFTLPAGATVTTEGEPGDRYFLILDGELSVLRGGADVAVIGSGSSFGEIALLHDVPRTATVACLGDVALLAVERHQFLEAVTGHPRSLRVAHDIADAHLHDDR